MILYKKYANGIFCSIWPSSQLIYAKKNISAEKEASRQGAWIPRPDGAADRTETFEKTASQRAEETLITGQRIGQENLPDYFLCPYC